MLFTKCPNSPIFPLFPCRIFPSIYTAALTPSVIATRSVSLFICFVNNRYIKSHTALRSRKTGTFNFNANFNSSPNGRASYSGNCVEVITYFLLLSIKPGNDIPIDITFERISLSKSFFNNRTVKGKISSPSFKSASK